MPDSIIWGAVFLFSLLVLIISADFFIKASEKIGLALGIPPFIIGVTLVGAGTSLPELVTSIIGVMNDSAEIVSGNVIGSNIANICLVLGFIAIFSKQITLEYDIMRVDMPLLLGATFFLGISVLDGKFTTYEGFICLLGLLIYLGYVLQLSQSNRKSGMAPNIPQEDVHRVSFKEPLILLASIVAIYLSAKYNVQAIIKLSELFNVGKEFIALTAVALGTSLPELAVSVAALRSNNTEMAIGNVLGSNIFNIFGVMGIPSLITSYAIPETISEFSLPLMVAVTLLVFFVTLDKKINRWEGSILLMFYAYFISHELFSII